MSCATKHPERPELACVLQSSSHPDHLAIVMAEDLSRTRLTWPNEEYRSAEQLREQQRTTRAKVTELAVEMRKVVGSTEPTKRKGDPNKIHTKLGHVANFLANHVNEWIPGRRFTDPNDIDGGSEGLRRIRQLDIDFGWGIEDKPDPDPHTSVHVYRCTYIPPTYIIRS